MGDRDPDDIAGAPFTSLPTLSYTTGPRSSSTAASCRPSPFPEPLKRGAKRSFFGIGSGSGSKAERDPILIPSSGGPAPLP